MSFDILPLFWAYGCDVHFSKHAVILCSAKIGDCKETHALSMNHRTNLSCRAMNSSLFSPSSFENPSAAPFTRCNQKMLWYYLLWITICNCFYSFSSLVFIIFPWTHFVLCAIWSHPFIRHITLAFPSNSSEQFLLNHRSTSAFYIENGENIPKNLSLQNMTNLLIDFIFQKQIFCNCLNDLKKKMFLELKICCVFFPAFYFVFIFCSRFFPFFPPFIAFSNGA